MRVWKTSRWLLLFPLLLMGCTLLSRRAPVEPPPASPLWTPIPIGSGVQIPPTVTPTPGGLGLPTSPIVVQPTPTTRLPTVVQPSPTFTPRPRNTPIPIPTSSARWTPVVPVRPGPVIYAPRVLSPPTIDGDLGEWSFMTPISINNITYGTGAYRGPQDLSGLLYVAWDDTHLYLAFQVTDDQFVQQASGRYLYRGDSTEILVDTNLLGDQNARVLNLDDYQLGFSPGNPVGQNPEVWLWYPRSMERRATEVRIAALPWAHGYQIEVAVPWSTLGVYPQAGLRLGFNAAISDNDAPGTQVQQSMASTSPFRRLTNPTTWGELVLLP